MKCEIWKDGRQVTTEVEVTKRLELNGRFDGVKSISLYYFNTIHLLPPIVYEHMAGQGLAHWLEGCELRGIDTMTVVHPSKDLRYIHGRTEVLRGNPTVSTVLLAHPIFSKAESPGQWVGYVPEIFKQFMADG